MASRISCFIGEALQPVKIQRRWLLIICLLVFVVAVGVRLLHWQNNRLTIGNMMSTIAARYKEEAEPLIHGDLKGFLRGPLPEPDTGLLMHTPGYPVFIAAVQPIVGSSTGAMRLVHLFCGAAAAVMVVLIAIELLPSAVALLAGMFAAISPQLSFYSLVLLPDSVGALPLLLAIYLLVLARKRTSSWLVIAAGIAVGISCWLRANLLLIAPFLCLAMLLWFPRTRWWRYSVLLIAATILTIAPITIRNAIVFKSFIPLSLSTGTNLIEGIADYDAGRRFGMPQYDHEVAQQEAALYNRPDYAEDLYRPDGILRERLRVGRALAVARGNKLWFMSVMVRRAGKMLTYEPVAIVSTEPSVTNSIDTKNAQLAWRGSPFDLKAGNSDSRLTPTPSGQTLLISSDARQGALALSTIKVEPRSDYLLTMPVLAREGRMVINLILPDSAKTLASATIPDSLDPAAERVGELTVLRVPFVNASADRLNIVVANGSSSKNTIEVGPIDLYRLGPASYLWTKYPRLVVKSFQKLFTTRWMLPAALFGVLLLALGRRFDTLAIVAVVPVYFLSTHAAMHLELRYILPVHYFWAMLVGTSVYFIVFAAWRLVHRIKSTHHS